VCECVCGVVCMYVCMYVVCVYQCSRVCIYNIIIQCKTYIIACANTGKAMLIDPVHEHFPLYLSHINARNYQLEYCVDTHTHADHASGTMITKRVTQAKVVMSVQASAPHVDIHLAPHQQLMLGDHAFTALPTPGHTSCGMSLFTSSLHHKLKMPMVFTGDALFINGCGRCDFPGGDAGTQYDSVVSQLFKLLPDDTIVFPAHDYHDKHSSTIGHEKKCNSRFANTSRQAFITLMDKLYPKGGKFPSKIEYVLQPNQAGLIWSKDSSIKWPAYNKVQEVVEIEPRTLAKRITRVSHGGGDDSSDDGSDSNEDNDLKTSVDLPKPVIIDVRERAEAEQDGLGKIPGSIVIPLPDILSNAHQVFEDMELDKSVDVVFVCRVGMRSQTAACVAAQLGFKAMNLAGGMLAWNEIK